MHSGLGRTRGSMHPRLSVAQSSAANPYIKFAAGTACRVHSKTHEAHALSGMGADGVGGLDVKPETKFMVSPF
jgi:hypothetical protein